MELNTLNANILSKFGQSAAAFSFALMELAEAHPEVVVLSADTSTPAGLDKFKRTYPDRFYNVGIAEQNLIGIAAGLSSEGWLPIVQAQACFITMRSFEQVRQYCGYMGFPLIIAGYGAGLSLEFMGNTHYSFEDMGLMRSIPGMTVVSPSDSGMATKALKAAVDYRKPIYIRFTDKTGCPKVYQSEFDYQIGENITLKEGNDVQIFAIGSMVSRALKATELLSENGLSVGVVDTHTLKPFDAVAINNKAKLLVTVEEHNTINGLGATLSDYLYAEKCRIPLIKIGINDRFSEVGDYEYLLSQHGLTPERITENILNRFKEL